MKNIVVPALLAAVVAAVVSILVGRSGYGGPAASSTVTNAVPGAASAAEFAKMLASYRKNPASTTLTLSMEDKHCKAEVDSDPVGNLPDKWVLWYVINEDCVLNDKETVTKVKLVFTPSSKKQYPFSKKEVFSKKHQELNYIHEQIKLVGADPDKEVDYTRYAYKVYLLNGKDVDPGVPILDPDLEVEGGSNNVPPAQKPPAPAPATAPPAKKQ